MKHLKAYKLFESIEDELNNIKENCYDILVELVDDDIVVDVKALMGKFKKGNTSNRLVQINFGDYRKPFTLNKYMDELRRINDYLTGLGYRYSQSGNKFESRMHDISRSSGYVAVQFDYIKD